MTKINSLVIRGFKSFAKFTEFEFTDKFNCIIGPNGSGKSNVLDALCFVLGKSSTKSLRAEKSANLIYNGGKTKKQGTEAEVSIWFDNAEKEFPSEDKEIKISRIVKAKGNSVYKINDKTRTRQEIIDLLSLAKINPNGYNIILQGDIVRFVNMSSVERRQLIEEIAGIGVYEDRKHKAIGELNKVTDKIEGAKLVLNEKKTFLNELEKEKKQAIRYNTIKEKLIINKATHNHRQLKAKKEITEEFTKREEELKVKLNEVNTNIADRKKEILEQRNELKKINSEIEEKSEKEQLAISKDLEDLKIQLATAKTRVENNKNELAKIEMRKEQLKSNREELEEKINNSKLSETQFKEKQDASRKDLDELEEKIAHFKKENKLDSATEYEDEMHTKDVEIEQLQNEINQLRFTQQKLIIEQDRLGIKITNYDEQIARLKEIENEHKEQIQQLKNLKEQFKRKTIALNDALNKDSNYAAQLGQKKSEMMLITESLDKLNAKYNAAMASLLRDTALKEVNELKKENHEIYGSVTELADVEEKYALALEIAAGNKIKGIVVDNEQIAIESIKHLRSKKAGIATFFPLNKIKPREVNENLKELSKKDGVIGFATDLIRYDPKFENIFSFIFGGTLVVDTIEHAKQIGVNKAKMVTLTGDLIEKSGAMQGGFRQQKSAARFSHKQLKEQIDRKEEDRISVQSYINDIITQRNKNENSIEELRKEKAELEGEVIKLEKSLHLDATDTDTLKKQKLDSKSELTKIDKELDQFSNKIGLINRDLANKKIQKQHLRDQINELRNPKILAQLNAFEETRKDLTTKQLQYELDTKNAGIQYETFLRPEKDKIAVLLKNLKTEEADIKVEIAGLDKNIKIATKELKEKEENQSKFQKKYKGLFEKRQKVSDIIDKKEDLIDKQNEALRKTEIKINSITLQREQISSQIIVLQEESEKYQGIEVDTVKADAQIKGEITKFEKYIAEFGNVNLKAIEMYEAIRKEYDDLISNIKKLGEEKEDVIGLIEQIEEKKTELFMNTFNIVNAHFKKFFSTLSTKGDASIVIENPEKPFEEGVLVKVKLKGTKYIDIRSLSGGEKTMTALAFIFAIQEFEPASFIIMDEVDAALDKKNAELLSQMVAAYSNRAQFIVISHNEVVITHANTLYGISMDESSTSKVTTLNLDVEEIKKRIEANP